MLCLTYSGLQVLRNSLSIPGGLDLSLLLGKKSNVPPPPHKKVKEICFESMKPNFFAFVTGVFLGFEEFSRKKHRNFTFSFECYPKKYHILDFLTF